MEEQKRTYTKITNAMKADIIAGLLVGLGVCELSRQHGIAKSAVSKIKSELDEDQKSLLPENAIDRIEDLLISSLKEHLKAIETIAKVGQDERYIRTQSAGQIADLHQQLTNWSVQLLSAANPDREQ
jgi:transposase-like protein